MPVWRKYAPVVRLAAVLAVFVVASPRAAADGCAFVIAGAHILTGNETHECVTITSTGLLITNSYTFTITGASGLTCNGQIQVNAGSVVLKGGGTSTLNGSLSLSTLASFLVIEDSSCTIAGTGSIEGKSATCKIQIEPGTTFTSRVTIKGKLIIAPSLLPLAAGFRNEGTVLADQGVIQLSTGLALSDSVGAWWKVRGNPFVPVCTLRFDPIAKGLRGHFGVYGGGQLLIHLVVTTSGILDYDSGTAELPLPLVSYFKYGSDNCESPHDPPPNPMFGPMTVLLSCP